MIIEKMIDNVDFNGSI